MSLPSTRLDTFTVHLVTRLEATRRAHLDDEAAARAAFARVIEEAAHALAAECRDTLGDEAQARLIEREAHETLLPRYTRMALAQNRAESRPYGLLGDGPVARVIATVAAVLVAAVISRFMPGFMKEGVFVLAALTPIVPEIQLWWVRRSWARQLQELADDMGRVQDAAEALPETPLAEPEPTHRTPQPQKVDQR